jgi:hypothetical protein
MTAPDRATRAWGAWWRAWYRLLRMVEGPLVRVALGRGFGNLIVMRVPGRRTGRERAIPLGLLTLGDQRYLGHPSGEAGWTRDLQAAGEATIESGRIARSRVRPVLLRPGPERDAAIGASFRQHPFPGNLMYRLAGEHVRSNGIFLRLDPEDGTEDGIGHGTSRSSPPERRGQKENPGGRDPGAPGQ